MLNSANQAWTMYPGLSHGAYECLHTYGTDEQKQLYLAKLTSGHWTGTMCLTEPQCGTDLGLLRTKAEPQADGTYRLTGNKIFISAGEHDMAENIVHLVLARLPDAPSGSKGISLFAVPKWSVKADGSLGERNAIWCGGLEHKMGIHGNATAQIVLENAAGSLVGQPNKGLQAMFVMMNAARLGVGMQSLGLTEVAYQNAAAYAKERLQMRSLSGPKAPDKPADPIIVHPDVRKMLLTARAYAEGGRALAMFTTLLLDREIASDDEEEKKECADLVALLTPIVKAFFTDNAWIATSHCLQVFGGHGYIREWGMEQFVRDSRINMIYEGTNTIQSLDLLGRKVLSDNGAKLKKFGKLIAGLRRGRRHRTRRCRSSSTRSPTSASKVTKLTTEIGMKAFQNPDEVGAAAVDYLRVCGHLVFAYLWARMAKVALEKQSSGDTVLRRQARDGALLLRQAAAGDGGAHPQRPRRRCADDGLRCGPVLNPRHDNPLSPTGDPAHDFLDTVLALALAGAAFAAGAQAASPAGLWKTIDDDTKKEKSLVRIVETGGVYSGKIEKLLDPDAPNDAVCKDCTDDRKDKPSSA